ncbi:sigma-54-dependent transcriptional regulator [Tahibacter amnicola]|uniref:Sigma-54 dependent transcriptional regulator n=1 Tax=Tahibacter amnicola TaxID=2976241 RepID=A0ABY6BIR5_9GAMM|nr:sigma-54 dependent transcriptional regulator [Tahibacter amnicola]UXI68990.1 sigma-54 dependent transcriptional regulator [Tahibacter amnicola]
MEKPSKPSVLVVDDDIPFAEAACVLAEMQGFSCAQVTSLAAARAILTRQRFDLILVDLELPDGSGFDLVEHIDLADTAAIAIVTGNPSVDTAARAVRLPVFDYLVKPIDPARFKDLLDRAAVGWQSRRPRERTTACGELIGATPVMREVFRQIRRVAPTEATVLIHGESGTGKELAASAIHAESGRRGGFVAVNCGAVAPELLASQLFGHEKGSFTGAIRQHQGFFEQAHGGTILLDEITEMPSQLQVHLLRVLETRRVTRVGGTREYNVDVRVIAATNRPPRQAVDQGALREDLYYRLADFPLELPPLRARLNDVPLVAQLFLERLNERYGLSRRFGAEVPRVLMSYAWPGNVRELRNVIQRAYILSEGDEVHLPALNVTPSLPIEETDLTVTFPVGTSFEEMERKMLLKSLAHFGNDKVRTAEALGISVKTIYNRLSRYAANDDPDSKSRFERT